MSAPCLQFIVDAKPVAQPRQRHRVFNGIAMNYTPSRHPVQALKKHIALLAALAVRKKTDWNYRAPFALDVVFQFKRPKSHFRANGVQLLPGSPAEHVQTPGLDNLVKAVKDSLTTAGLWKDDCQVVNEKTSKRWSNCDCIIIAVYEFRRVE